MPHEELHTTQRIGWLRAAVLGANDGIVSTPIRRLEVETIPSLAPSTAARSQPIRCVV